MQMPKEYVSKKVSSYNSTLAENTTKVCNEMLEKGFIYVGTVGHVQESSSTLLFAKY